MAESRRPAAGKPLEQSEKSGYDLQLLEGLLNVSKNDSLPAEWLASTYPDAVQRQAVLDRHDLGKVPATALEFMQFYKSRRDRIRQRLTSLLSRSATVQDTSELKSSVA
jgi:hypothetical protein